MPSFSDVSQFFRGQVLQTPTLPSVDLSGRTVIVTGANTGLGFECAKQLVDLRVSTLILACRNMSKGETARKAVERHLKGGHTSIKVWQIDMADYSSITSFVDKAKSELPTLDALLVNAGMDTTEFSTAEGLETTLTVNVVGAFLLSLLLLPHLKQTAIKRARPTNLTIVGSSVHAFAAHAQLQAPPAGQIFATLSKKDEADMGSRYFLSKLMVLQGVQELAERVSRREVIINCPNPGWCKTELFRQDDGGFFGRNLLKLIGRTGEVGARTLTSAIVAGEETHGKYLSECQIKPASSFARGQEGQQLRRKTCKELLGILESISMGVTQPLR